MKKTSTILLLVTLTLSSLFGNPIQNAINLGPGVHRPKLNEQGELISFVAVGSGRIRKSLPKHLAIQQARKDAAREARNETSKFFNTSVKWGENAANEMVCVTQGNSANNGEGSSTESSKFTETSGEKSKSCSQAALSGLRKIGAGYDEAGLYCEVWAWDYKTVKGIINASKAMGKAARTSINQAKAVEGARKQNPVAAYNKATAEDAAATTNANADTILDGVQNIRTDNQGNVISLQIIGVEAIPSSATSAPAKDQIKKVAQQNAIKHFGEFLSGSKVSVVSTASSQMTMNISNGKESSTNEDKSSEVFKDKVKTLLKGLSLTDIKIQGTYAVAIYTWSIQTTQGGSGSAPTQDGWIRCIGFGTSREKAVKAALVEGVQQIFGAQLSSSTESKQKFASFVQGNDQGHSEQSTASQESTTNTLTQTHGFVREYKIVSVEPASDGSQKATVDALIVNPRGNGVRTVMVYPMSLTLDKLTSNFNVGPEKRLSGSEIALLAAKNFEKAFSSANKFIVINKNDFAKVLSHQKAIAKGVKFGSLPPNELSKLGKLLSADYILISELLDLRYSRKVGYNKALRKFAPTHKFVASASFRLVSVEDGGNVFNKTFDVVLSNEQIQKALEKDENADLLRTIMEAFTTKLNEVIPQ